MDLIEPIARAGQAPAAAFVAVAALSAAVAIRRRGVHAWYVVVFAVAAAAASLGGSALYFWAFALGAAAAFTEIITKFRDEPLKAFKTPEAVYYHVFNGLVAAFALYALRLSGTATETPADALRAVTAAGLGSMLLMRSKFFNIRVGDEDVSFGPEQFVKVFLGFMEKAIDRVRAQARIDFVQGRMRGIDCDKVEYYCVTMLEAAQLLEDPAREGLKNKIHQICARTTDDRQLRAYELGFALANTMGEGFVARIFRNAPDEYRLGTPARDTSAAPVPEPIGLPSHGAGDLYYFAYGRDMCTRVLLKRLGWSRAEAEQAWSHAKPTRATLNGYRLVFGKPDADNPEAGLATVQPDPDQAVEGVLYRLPAAVSARLDARNGGYRRIPVTPQQGDQVIEAVAYVAEEPQALKPVDEYLLALLAGAREHDLSPAYVRKLGQTETLRGPAAPTQGAPVASEPPTPGTGAPEPVLAAAGRDALRNGAAR